MNVPTAPGYTAEEPTHAPPWHGLVVWDVLFNALTTGLFVTAAVGELVRPAAFAPVAVWAYPVALVLLLTDLVLLVLDLGDKLRFHHMLRVFKPSSPMSLGTWCLTAYSLPLTALVAVDLLGAVGALPPGTDLVNGLRVALLAVGLPSAFGSMAYKGVLFSTSAQPGWKDARWLGAYHVASAFALGSAVLLGLAALTESGAAAGALRPAVGVLVAAQVIPLVLLANDLWPAARERFRRGRLMGAAAVALGAGVAVPLALLAAGGTVALVLAAGAAVVGGWAVRDLVVTLPHHDVHPSVH